MRFLITQKSHTLSLRLKYLVLYWNKYIKEAYLEAESTSDSQPGMSF